MPTHRRATLACFVLVEWLATTACTPTCDLEGSPERFAGGHVTQVGAGSYYDSSSWHGELLSYPGGKRYQIEHGLGIEPVVILTYLSFASGGVPTTATAGADSITLCAGDSCKIELVNRELIQIHNTTCADFWLRVVAWGGPTTPGGLILDAGAQDAP